MYQFGEMEEMGDEQFEPARGSKLGMFSVFP